MQKFIKVFWMICRAVLLLCAVAVAGIATGIPAHEGLWFSAFCSFILMQMATPFWLDRTKKFFEDIGII